MTRVEIEEIVRHEYNRLVAEADHAAHTARQTANKKAFWPASLWAGTTVAVFMILDYTDPALGLHFNWFYLIAALPFLVFIPQWLHQRPSPSEDEITKVTEKINTMAATSSDSPPPAAKSD